MKRDLKEWRKSSREIETPSDKLQRLILHAHIIKDYTLDGAHTQQNALGAVQKSLRLEFWMSSFKQLAIAIY